MMRCYFMYCLGIDVRLGLCYYLAVLMLLQDIDGRNTQMKKYKGKVVLAVNVASQCGFTKQYKVANQLMLRIPVGLVLG